MMKEFACTFEVLFSLRYPSCSQVFGKRIETSTSVIDMTNGSIGSINSKVYSLLKTAAALTSDNYPENMGQMFVVNAPFLFAGVWAICKTFLDERTTRKIHIIGGSFQKQLLEVIDADSLPDFLGGTCKCENLGGCMKSNIGPWNDFECLDPIGIRKKAISSFDSQIKSSDGGSTAGEEQKE